MHDDSPIHFDGLIPNASRTPRHEVGGLAVFEGVLMRSRTGFAIAVRREDGAVTVRQFPYASLIQKRRAFGVPFIRGTAALAEMMMLGTRALRYSSSLLDNDEPETEEESSPGRLAFLLTTSLAMMAVVFVAVPEAAAALLFHLPPLSDWLEIGQGVYTSADYPFLFNLAAGFFRLLVLVGYVASLSFSEEIRRVLQYHGAEHKAVSALEAGRDVTVGRARLHDTLHPRCGTTLLAVLALLAIPIFAIVDTLLRLYVSGYPGWPILGQKAAQVFAHLLVLPFVVGAGFETVKYCARRIDTKWCRWVLWPGMLFQRLTTRQPDDRQLEVAIIALFSALAIHPGEIRISTYTVRGLEDDDTAPGYVKRSPARPAPPPENDMEQTGAPFSEEEE